MLSVLEEEGEGNVRNVEDEEMEHIEEEEEGAKPVDNKNEELMELDEKNFSNIYFQDVPAQAGKGVYKVQRLSHSGDSWGDNWSSTITGFKF